MKTRIEHDLLGNKEVPMDAYYGVQTLRAIENFAGISNYTIGMFPNYVKALAMVKWAAAKANFELGLIPADITNAITAAPMTSGTECCFRNIVASMISPASTYAEMQTALCVLTFSLSWIAIHAHKELNTCRLGNTLVQVSVL